MRNIFVLGALAALAAPAFGQAAPTAASDPGYTLTGNVSLVSDYAFRGVSQTDGNPALQGGLDLAIGNFYAGTWGSNINFGTGGANLEWDVYSGYKVPLGAVTLDLGVIGYLYPSASDKGAELDYWEFYAKPSFAVTKDFTVGAAVNYSPEFTGKSGEGWYYEANGAYTVNPAFSISGAVGHQMVALKGFFAGKDNYTTWNFGGTYTALGLGFDLRYVGTDASRSAPSIYKDRVIFSIKKSM